MEDVWGFDMTTPTILYKCPKCNKEHLSITFSLSQYCNCTYDHTSYPPKSKGTKMICITRRK
jgi:hypothetical protein